MGHDLESSIIERAVGYVLEPPSDDDKVVDFTGPGDLLARFDEVLPIGFGERVEAAPDSTVAAAVDLVVRHSVHTSHPRFLNQNFAGPDPVAVVATGWVRLSTPRPQRSRPRRCSR